ncbi:MAG: hypothetical protein ACREBJ_04710 [Nitrosotalea sp.]
MTVGNTANKSGLSGLSLVPPVHNELGVGVGVDGPGVDVGPGVGVGVDVGIAVKIIFPKAVSLVFVVVSVTVMASVPTCVDVALKVAIPIAFNVVEVGLNNALISPGADRLMVSPFKATPELSFNAAVILAIVTPSATTVSDPGVVEVSDEWAASGGLPANVSCVKDKNEKQKKGNKYNYMTVFSCQKLLSISIPQ